MHSWLGKYPVSDLSHFDDLERAAAVHEHHFKLPRAQAEASAHQKYKVLEHQKAAAHHLNGMKKANATGRHADGQRHYMMYCLHLKALGLNPNGSVPAEVTAHVDDSPLDKFTEHPSDGFVSSKS